MASHFRSWILASAWSPTPAERQRSLSTTPKRPEPAMSCGVPWTLVCICNCGSLRRCTPSIDSKALSRASRRAAEGKRLSAWSRTPKNWRPCAGVSMAALAASSLSNGSAPPWPLSQAGSHLAGKRSLPRPGPSRQKSLSPGSNFFSAAGCLRPPLIDSSAARVRACVKASRSSDGSSGELSLHHLTKATTESAPGLGPMSANARTSSTTSLSGQSAACTFTSQRASISAWASA
mmetsp:Transcript_92431/g.206623  ORF Transcript_92431/g.206623 Transcript_92431/m.206623 type:complete len:234 (+) Transcript_92431:941-1642(+)